MSDKITVEEMVEWIEDLDKAFRIINFTHPHLGFSVTDEDKQILQAIRETLTEQPKVATKGICKWHGEIKPEVEIVHLCPECLEPCFVTEFGTEVEG